MLNKTDETSARASHRSPFGELCGPDLAVGVKAGSRYQTATKQLRRGESILFYSDGIVEAENVDQERFGMARVLDHVAAASGPPWGIELLHSINRWRGASAVNDDVTLMEIWRDDHS